MLIRLPPAPRLYCRYLSTNVGQLAIYGSGKSEAEWLVCDRGRRLASGFESREAAEKWVDDVAKLVNGAGIRIIGEL